MDEIGRILVIEFHDQDVSVFDDIIAILKSVPDFETIELHDTITPVPGFEIYPGRRKVYCGQEELQLTAKEYEILYLLVANIGHILTYEQIYQRIWGVDALGNERNTVGCHIRNLRRKICNTQASTSFEIRCIREVGYCFDIK